jgi:hypothetical protein
VDPAAAEEQDAVVNGIFDSLESDIDKMVSDFDVGG